MLRLLFVAVFSIVLAPTESCTYNCQFLYQNPRGELYNVNSSIYDTRVTKEVDSGSVTGLVTLYFDMFYSSKKYSSIKYDYLYLRRDSGSNQYVPLYIRFDSTDRVRAAGINDWSIPDGSEIFPDSRHPIQIADTYTDYLRLYIGTAGSARKVDFNYDGPSSWDEFQNAGNILSRTTQIYSDGYFTVYKYISACAITTPEICGSESEGSQTVIINQLYEMKCVVSGAPFLGVTWSKDESEELPDGATQSSTIYDDSLPDHKITSTIHISAVKHTHLGSWKCTVTNKNLQSYASKVFQLVVIHEPAPVIILSEPLVDYFVAGSDFTWEVEGWHLADVILTCICLGGNNISITRDTSGYLANVPPRVKFTVSPTNIDTISCSLENKSMILASYSITRVGYGCKVGEFGVKKSCEVCPKGETSLAGSHECFTPDEMVTIVSSGTIGLLILLAVSAVLVYRFRSGSWPSIVAGGSCFQRKDETSAARVAVECTDLKRNPMHSDHHIEEQHSRVEIECTDLEINPMYSDHDIEEKVSRNEESANEEHIYAAL